MNETEETTNESGIANSSARVLPAGTVCLSRTASVGYVVVMGTAMATSQDFVNWVCGPQLLPRFLQYLFMAEGEDILRFASGAVHQTIYFPEAKAFWICAPNIVEQRRIAAILDEGCEAIATAKANTERVLRSAEVLVKEHLRAIFERNRADWITQKLDEAVRFIDYRGKTPPKRDRGIRLITAKNVRMGWLEPEPQEFADAEVYDSWMTRGIPQLGDVLFTTEAPLGNVAQLNTEDRVLIGQRLITMQPMGTDLDRSFLKYALMTPQVQAEIQSNATGATVLGIKASLLKTVSIWYPSDPSAQAQVVRHLTRLEDEIETLSRVTSRKLAVIDELKRSLLCQAFTGQLTARSAEKQLALAA